MKNLIFTLIFTLFFVSIANGQTVADCPHPSGCVVLSVEQARQSLEDRVTVKAQADEILTLRESVVKQKEVTVDIKIEYAKTLGELVGAKGELISLRAQLEFVLKNGRNKCGGLTLFCIQK